MTVYNLFSYLNYFILYLFYIVFTSDISDIVSKKKKKKKCKKKFYLLSSLNVIVPTASTRMNEKRRDACVRSFWHKFAVIHFPLQQGSVKQYILRKC